MIIHVEIDDIDLLDEYGLYLIDRDIGVATPNLYKRPYQVEMVN